MLRVWVKEQKVIVKNGKIAEYRVDLKVTFYPNRLMKTNSALSLVGVMYRDGSVREL
jgi:hypothetical protein